MSRFRLPLARLFALLALSAPAPLLLEAQGVAGKFLSHEFDDPDTGSDCMATPSKLTDKSATTVKVIFSCPDQTLEVNIVLDFKPDLPPGTVEATNRFLVLEREFLTSLTGSVTWSRPTAGAPYRAQFLVATESGSLVDPQQSCSSQEEPTGVQAGTSTFSRTANCRWTKLGALVGADPVDPEIPIPSERPLAFFVSVVRMVVTAADPDYSTYVDLRWASYYSLQSVVVKPSVVFPKETGAQDAEIELSGLPSQQVTAVQFGTLPPAQILSRAAQSTRIRQTVGRTPNWAAISSRSPRTTRRARWRRFFTSRASRSWIRTPSCC